MMANAGAYLRLFARRDDSVRLRVDYGELPIVLKIPNAYAKMQRIELETLFLYGTDGTSTKK